MNRLMTAALPAVATSFVPLPDIGVLVNRYIRPLEALAETSSKDLGL